MLTSLFRKSTPISYALVLCTALLLFFIQYFNTSDTKIPNQLYIMIGGLVLFFSMFTVNFIIKKNGLSRDSGFAILFFLLLVLFFPAVFTDPNLLLANCFILLAMRRLLSLTSMKATREKIFDASLWIFVAALFHFWAISFILLVFVSLFFNVSRDYRNWILPFIAFFGVAVLFAIYHFTFSTSAWEEIKSQSLTNINLNFLVIENHDLAFYTYIGLAAFFFLSMVGTLSRRPQQVHSGFKKCMAWLVMAFIVFVLSPHKQNTQLIFTVAPLAIISTAFVEYYFQSKWKSEIIIWIVLACACFCFATQL
jgi:hypothetical protein